MRHVDLCSGIGGFALGFEMAGLSKPILFCEIDKWCQKILRQHWRDVPILENVKDLANDPARLVPDCDILTAGYPCQPFSTAGKRKGEKDDRHIWPYIMQIVTYKRPTWCVFENVSGHISLGLDKVLSDLEAEDYSARPFVIGACDVHTPHRRLRVWIVAHSNRSSDRRTSRQYEETNGEVSKRHDSGVADQSSEVCTSLANSDSFRLQGSRPQQQTTRVARKGKDVADTNSEHGKVRGQHQPDAKESLRRGGDATGSRSDDWRQSRTLPDEADVADTNSQRPQGDVRQGKTTKKGQSQGYSPECSWWPTEPNVGRVAHGIPKRLDRIKGLGNAIVPQIAERIGRVIKEIDDASHI